MTRRPGHGSSLGGNLVQTAARHLLVELSGCDPVVLDDLDALRSLLCSAVEAAGAKVVNHVFHPFAPHGVTGVVLIEESHCSIHTWPELRYAAVDFYTCGDAAPERAIALLVTGLCATRAELLEVARGVGEPHPKPLVTRSARFM